MEQLIPIVNKLHDALASIGGGAGTDAGIDLPQIIVVGTQSSGKSSVLESIVGKDFLPRGVGVVTRRPLVLQLVHTPDSSQEWAEFLHQPGVRHTDFSQVRAEIVRETERLTGTNKGISSAPIRLRVHSPFVVDLTLVDLPGITRIPVGDQPANIEHEVKTVVAEYAKRPGTIILAVTAANTDPSTSDALQIAREADPAGSRTLGVLTKIDLMDKGTDAAELLAGPRDGSALCLKLGYVGVVCRGQSDIGSGKSLKRQLEDEKRFFATHPKYQRFSDRCGCEYLARRLSQLLVCHIRERLPALRQQVTEMLSEVAADAELCGLGLAERQGVNKAASLLQLITRYAEDLGDVIDGRLELSLNAGPRGAAYRDGIRGGGVASSGFMGSSAGLTGGARIAKAFEGAFSRRVDEEDSASANSMRGDEIHRVIANAAGPRAALFIPEAAFDLLVRSRIAQLEPIGLQCADQVFEELSRLVLQIAERRGSTNELQRYPRLKSAIVKETQMLLGECLVPTKEMIRNLVRIELAYVNTGHPDFIGGDRAIAIVNERLAKANKLADEGGGASPSTPSGPRQYRCFMCDELVTCASEAEFNDHLDHCLTRNKQQDSPSLAASNSAPAGTSAVPSTQNSGFLSGWWRARPETTTEQESHHQSPPPPPPKPGSLQPNQPAPAPKTVKTRQQPTSSPPPVPPKAQPSPVQRQRRLEEKQRFETELIRTLVESYMGIVKKNVKDSVPKSVMHFLVRGTTERLQSRLVQALYKGDEKSLDEVMEEDAHLAAKRQACRQRLETLQKATDIITQVKDESFVGSLD